LDRFSLFRSVSQLYRKSVDLRSINRIKLENNGAKVPKTLQFFAMALERPHGKRLPARC
jgi:hypothetical protein